MDARSRSARAYVLGLLLCMLSSAFPARADDPPINPAQRVPVETLMQEVQARHLYLTGEYVAWPPCCGTSDEAPPFPPQGYYDACIVHESDMLDLLYELYAIIKAGPGLESYFVDPDWVGQGTPATEQPGGLTPLLNIDFAPPSGPPKPTEVYAAINAQINRMSTVTQSVGFDIGEHDFERGIGFSDSLDTPGDCEPVRARAEADYGERADTGILGFTETLYKSRSDIYIELEGQHGRPRVTPNWPGTAGRGRFYACGEATGTVGNIGCVISLADVTDPLNPETPKWQLVSNEVEVDETTREWIGDDFLTGHNAQSVLPCEDENVSWYRHWEITGLLCVYRPDWTYEDRKGKCASNTPLPGDPRDGKKPPIGGGKGPGGPKKPKPGECGDKDCEKNKPGAGSGSGTSPGAAGDGAGADRGGDAAPGTKTVYINGVPYVIREHYDHVLDGNSTPCTGKPVSLAFGTKIEQVTDLAVPVSGFTFKLTRQYTSDGLNANDSEYGLVGANWITSAFSFLAPTPVSGQSKPDLIWGGSALETGRYFLTSASPAQWKQNGPVTGWAEEATLELDGASYATYRVVEPGESQTDFFRADKDVASELVGLPLQWRDMYGNNRTYFYEVFGTTGNKVARLVRVDLNHRQAVGDTRPNPSADAFVVFRWNILDVDEFPGAQGRLSRVEAHRCFADGRVAQVIQAVDYRYKGKEDHDDIGSEGDLVQVTYSDLVDGPVSIAQPVYWTRVQQYRYHRSEGSNTIPENSNGTVGGVHQLKLVISPEQIEYVAQKRQEDAATLSPTAVQEAAESLLKSADASEWMDGSTARLVLDLASKVVSYRTDGRVLCQFLQTACGCSGASQGVREDYTYLSFTPSGQTEWRSTRIGEHLLGTGGTYSPEEYRSRIFDMRALGQSTAFYGVNEVLKEPGGRTWCTHADYDSSYRLERIVMPSGVDSYTAMTSTTAPVVSFKSPGLYYGFAYNSDNRVTEYRIGSANAAVSTYSKIRTVSYPSSNTTFGRKYLPYRIDDDAIGDGSSADEINTTWYQYGFRSDDSIGWLRVATEAEQASENGPASTESLDPEVGLGTVAVHNSFVLYDLHGRPEWTRAEDKALSFVSYDATTGRSAKVVNNANRLAPDGDSASALNPGHYPALPSGFDTSNWGRYSVSTDSLATSFQHDALGRTVQITGPGGVKSYTRRELREFSERPYFKYLALVSLPFKLTEDGSFDGPLAVSLVTAGGNRIQSSEYSLNATADYAPLNGTYTQVTELSRATAQHTYSGLLTSRKSWYDIAGGHNQTGGQGIYTTTYEQDALGRTYRVHGADGTITENALYDVLDRVLEVKVGTSTSGANAPQTIAKYYFDSGTTTTQAAGDGNLTRVDTYPSSTPRTTIRKYDARDRLVQVEPPDGPSEVMTYDNLDRPLERAVYEHGHAPSTAGDLTGTTYRGLYSKKLYNQRGMVYRQLVWTDPHNNSSPKLESDQWVDAVGRTLTQWQPNSPTSKRVVDGLGRTTVSYVVDHPTPSTLPSMGTHAEATAVTTNKVLEQTEYTYNGAGVVESAKNRVRLHTFGDSGSLDEDSGSTHSSIRSMVGYVYDSALRPIRTVNFGTSDANDVFRSGTLPTWPDATYPIPDWDTPAYANMIVVATAYNERGLVDSTKDPKGHVFKAFYDDLSRRTGVAENFHSASLEWNTTPTVQRWKVRNLEPTHQDRDRVTSFVYDANSQVVLQVAHLPGASTDTETVQATQYVYGTTLPTGTPGPMDSAIASNRLLHHVRYPNNSTGEPGDNSGTPRYMLSYAYNRLGELVAVEDQNLTRHDYTRDALGRVALDAATVPSGSPIDTRVHSIGVSYDAFGRLGTVTSYDGSNATVNAVGFTYTDLWQVHVLTENPLPTIVTPRTVTYFYDQPTSPTTAATNRSRLSYIEYPDSTQFTHTYGSDTDDLIGRINSLGLVDPRLERTLVDYTFAGLGMFVGVEYSAGSSGVTLDRTLSPDGKRRLDGKTTQDLGIYPGWDRFGRVKHHAWVDGDLTSTGTPAHPDRAMVFGESFTYDAASNRLSKSIGAYNAGMNWTDHNWDYHYDELDRLIEARRGVWSGGTLTIAKNSQSWDLDMLGNWRNFNTDLTSPPANPPSYTDSSVDRVDDRTHNKSNELTGRAVGLVGGTPVNLALAYDDAGNMKTEDRSSSVGLTYVHDAWNRLVEVKRSESSTTTSIAKYQYNGLHWRTVKLSDVRGSQTTTESLPERRVMYYDASWRLIQEDIDDHANDHTSSFTLDRRAQQFWGMRYIDDAVYRREDRGAAAIPDDPETPEDDYIAAHGPDHSYPLGWFDITDTQFSVVALMADNGHIDERIDYDPYGNARHHAPGDFDGSGTITIDDLFSYLNASGGPIDVKRDGLNNNDVLVFLNDWFVGGDTPAGSGWISAASGGVGSTTWPDNTIGYCGYLFDKETATYTVRFRHYNPGLGRWHERDPASRQLILHEYAYVDERPTRYDDAMGLYAIDVHKDLTTFLAEQMDCFSKDEAAAIGDADQGVDDNPRTRADLGMRWQIIGGRAYWAPDIRQRRVNRDWHDLTRGNGIKDGIHGAGGSGPAIWEQVLSNCDIKMLGKYLHVLQDTFAHQGWEDDTIGHLGGGFAPDHTMNDPQKGMKMAEATVAAMAEFIKHCRRDCYCEKMDGKENFVLSGPRRDNVWNFLGAPSGLDSFWGRYLGNGFSPISDSERRRKQKELYR